MSTTPRRRTVLGLLLAAALLSGLACTTGNDGGASKGASPTATAASKASPTSTAAATAAAPISTADPFAYCAQVGTIDAPDARYTGEKVPVVIAEGIKKATNAAADAPLEVFTRSTSWRCMDGKVYACTVGANLPCGEKANTSRTPSTAMTDFCTASPEAAVIPAAVTGRATVYAWRCTSGAPAVVRQVAEPDKQGFLANFWHEISRG